MSTRVPPVRPVSPAPHVSKKGETRYNITLGYQMWDGHQWVDAPGFAGGGEQGPPGPAGPAGPTGAMGATGATGPELKRYYGFGPPGTIIGSSPGDEYVNMTTGDLYHLS